MSRVLGRRSHVRCSLDSFPFSLLMVTQKPALPLSLFRAARQEEGGREGEGTADRHVE